VRTWSEQLAAFLVPPVGVVGHNAARGLAGGSVWQLPDLSAYWGAFYVAATEGKKSQCALEMGEVP